MPKYVFNEELTQLLNNLNNGIIPEKYPEIITNVSWRDIEISCEFRNTYTKFIGFSLISKNWISELKNLIIGNAKCLEIMSGRGLLSKALRDIGTDIIATDNLSWENDDDSNYKNWSTHFTDIEDIDAVKAVKKYGKDVKYIIVSWAPYDEPIAYNVLLKMREVNPDCKMIFIGEDYGGCTADYKFFNAVEIKLSEIEQDNLNKINKHYQRFNGIHDFIQIYN